MKIVFSNDSFSRHLDRPAEAITGTSFLDDIMPEDRAYVKGVITSVSRSSPSATCECREIPRLDEERWQQWTIRGIFRDPDDPSEFQAVGRDITERRMAEQRISRYITEIKFLSSTVSDFMKIQSTPHLFDTVGEHLMMLYPDSPGVMLYSLGPHGNEFTARAIRSNEETGMISLEKANRLAPLISGYAQDLAKGVIVNLDAEDLRAFLPDAQSSSIPARIILCGFNHQDDLLGTAVILVKDPIPGYSDTLLAAYLHQVATAMKRCSAEESSKEKEDLFRSIIEFSPLPISIISSVGRFLYCNPMFSRQFGYSLEDLPDISDWFWKAFPDGPSRSRAISLWNAGRKHPDGMHNNPELLVNCKDGSAREIQFHRVTLPDETEFAVFEDVTERNQARKNDRLLASIVNSTDDAIIAKTTEGIILSWNPAAERLYGYSAEEMIGKDIRTLAPPDLVGEMNDILKTISGGEHIDHYETRRKRKDGTLIDVSVTATPLVDDSRTIIGASSIIRDITAKKAEQRLLEAEEPYRKFIESIGVGFYRSSGDREGHFLWGNSSLARILGYASFDDLAGLTIADLFTESDGRGRLLAELREKGFVKNHEVFLRRHDGEMIWVRITALASFSESGAISSISGIIEDITELKQALLELESVKAAISPADRESSERRQLLDQVFLKNGIGLAVLAKDGTFRLWNDAFSQICNLKGPKTSRVRNLLTVVAPEDARMVSDALTRLQKTGMRTVHHRVMTSHGRDDVCTQLFPLGERIGNDWSLAVLMIMQYDQDAERKRRSVFR
jgi:PAS domain S-box-containing protein